MSLLLSNDVTVGGVISNAYHKNYFCHAEITYVLIYLSGKQNKNIDLSALYSHRWDKGGSIPTGGCPQKNFLAAFGGLKLFSISRFFLDKKFKTREMCIST